MSPLALGMDILLAALLAAALFIGARLNSRLAALRNGQAGFARAVDDLNAAAERADSALKALGSASEETHDALLDRITTARSLLARLEEASAAAERVQRRPEPPVSSRLTGLLDAVGRSNNDDGGLEGPRRTQSAPPASERAGIGARETQAAVDPLLRDLAPRDAPSRDAPLDAALRAAPLRDGERPPLRRTLSELLAARGRAPPEPAARPIPPAPRRRPAQDEDLFVDLDGNADDVDASFGRSL